jgi:hypothetical protein
MKESEYGSNADDSTLSAWTTGGSLLPDAEFESLIARAHGERHPRNGMISTIERASAKAPGS